MSSERVIAVILGGGRGQRLHPLTANRAKPAVPFGGKYRLVDVPISNCLHAGLREIYILTQYSSASLIQHIANTYRFDNFSRGFVEVLAAEQTAESKDWYLGTADAVRRNFQHLGVHQPTHCIVLSGDQLYRMDLMDMHRRHTEAAADLTVACLPVKRADTPGLGILQVDAQGWVTKFVEKPPLDRDISEMRLPAAMAAQAGLDPAGEYYLASMGIYAFDMPALRVALDNKLADFGSEVIPAAISSMRVAGHLFQGYWEDIGTIKGFYEANLKLASINPEFNLYREDVPIYTNRRNLPPSKINYSTIAQSLAAEGSIITNATIANCIIGIRTIIESGATLDGVVCMGADFYETPEDRAENRARGVPNVGIGRGSIIRRAIIDKNARIGEDCRIGIDERPRPDADGECWSIRDGIIVIHKNGVVPSGTAI
jgi:glucose-1-phosphate adenylyltransferase